MLGIIIDASMESEQFPNRILHKFQNKSSIERVVEASLRSEYAHRVLVAMSRESRPFAVGTTYRDTVIDQKISVLDRIATYTFYPKTPLERLYYTARDNQIDTIVRVRADSPFLPTWLINEAIYEYHKNPNVFLHTNSVFNIDTGDMYPEGLGIEIMPFWMLARTMIYLEDESEFYSYIEHNFKTRAFENIKETHRYIPNPNFTLGFKTKDQIPQFDSMLEALNYSDLGDLLKDMADG